MAATTSVSSLIIFSLIITTKATSDGFSVRLIHRDSPQFLFYNPRLTAFERIIASVNRSMARVNYLNSLSSKSLISDISNKLVYDSGEYIMIFTVGNPPITVHAIADTGSDVIWLKCLPCRNCDPHAVPPIFNPSKSSTFKRLKCQSLGEDHQHYCPFQINYGDGSRTDGFYVSDEFTFEGQTQNSIVSVGKLSFGCGEHSSPSSQPLRGKLQHGIVGLNRLGTSLVGQLGITKFSYCMVMPDREGESSGGSRMYFGSMSVVSGGQTPFTKWNRLHYSLTLEGISVGDVKVPIPDNFFGDDDDGQGGFIIDSGTTYTYLKSEAFDELVKLLRKAIRLPPLQSPVAPFKWCFTGSFSDLDSQPADITLHFLDADFILTKQSTYIYLEAEVWCLAILPTSRDISILGNFQQQNYWVGYDLEAEMVSFAPVDCATF